MKRPAKIALWTVGSLLLLVIAVVLVLVLTFDPNRYKAEIAAAVHKSTGRELTIEGDIGLTFFPWLGVQTGPMRLSNAPGFGDAPFASIRAAGLKVKLLPLLRKEVDVDVVTLDGLQLHLMRNAAGLGNWQDLVRSAAQESPSDQAGAAVPAVFGLGGVNLRDASITWDDLAASTRYEISKLHLRSGAIRPGQPVALDLEFDVNSTSPALGGRVQLATQARYQAEGQRLELGALKLEARLMTPAQNADFTLSAHALLDLAQQRYQANDVNLSGRLSGGKLPGKPIEFALTTRIDADWKDHRLALEPLTLTAPGLKADGAVHGRELVTAPRFDGSLNAVSGDVRAFMKNLGLTLNTADPTALQAARAQLAFNATKDELAVPQLRLTLDQTTMSGELALRGYTKPAVRFKLAADGIDADRYLPPAPKADAAHAEPMAAPPAAVAAAGAAALPLDKLRALDVDGTLTVGKLQIKKLKLNDIQMTVKAKDGLIAARPLLAQLYGGRYRGDVQLDARGSNLRLSTDDVLSNVAIGPLARDFLEKDLVAGSGNLQVRLAATGVNAEQMRRSLGGKLGFSFTDGRINGVNLVEMLQKDYLKYIQNLGGDTGQLNQTVFSKFAATAAVSGGVFSTDDLALTSAQLGVRGRGTVNIVTQQIDLHLDALPAGQFAKQLGDFKDVVVPVKIAGTLAAPIYSVDLDEALKRKAKARFDEEKGKLQQKLQQQFDKQKTESQQKLQEQQKKLEDKIQQQLQNKLKGLFQ